MHRQARSLTFCTASVEATVACIHCKDRSMTSAMTIYFGCKIPNSFPPRATRHTPLNNHHLRGDLIERKASALTWSQAFKSSRGIGLIEKVIQSEIQEIRDASSPAFAISCFFVRPTSEALFAQEFKHCNRC